MRVKVGITLLLALSIGGVSAEETTPSLEGRLIRTGNRVVLVDESGLPAQIELLPAVAEIPLAHRRETDPSATLLQRIGRGPQLSAPIRLEGLLDGRVIAAVAQGEATLLRTDQGVEVVGRWHMDEDVQGQLRVFYGDDGAVTGEVQFEAGDVPLERLDLVLELPGDVDTLMVGAPVAPADGSLLPLDYGRLPDGSGLLWRNGPEPAGQGAQHGGLIQHAYLGNGDRGFTWLAHDPEEATLRGDVETMRVERTAEGVTVWRIALLAGAAGERGGQEVAFTLLSHPARHRETSRRKQQWQPWPAEVPASGAVSYAVRGQLEGAFVRADAASVQESFARGALLSGPYGGAAQTVAATLADRFPIGLFRYLAATHTALEAQIRPDAAALVPAGGRPSADRMALGRALLHDIGVDIRQLSNPVGAASILQALDAFGVFADDSATEFLPYWRTDGILRYGEAFQAESNFEVTEENPAARASVSVYLRPVPGNPARRQALFVIVNESDQPVREQLYIQQPDYLFGGANRLTAASIYSQLDFSRIPSDSDWRQSVLIGSAIRYDGGGRVTSAPQLMDLETGGFVRSVATHDESEVYGLIHVPARGMRILLGAGER